MKTDLTVHEPKFRPIQVKFSIDTPEEMKLLMDMLHNYVGKLPVAFCNLIKDANIHSCVIPKTQGCNGCRFEDNDEGRCFGCSRGMSDGYMPKEEMQHP